MPVLVQDLKTLVASQMWQCCHSVPLCPLPPGLDWLGNPIGVLGKAAEETPGEKLSQGVVLAHGSPLPCRGSPMWYTGVVPAWTAPSFPETIPAGALAALP